MAKKIDISQYETFEQITGRLDDIVGVVRDSETSLERSLDLFEEAIALGSHAVEMVDASALTPEERSRLAAQDVEEKGAAQKAAASEAGVEQTTQA